MLWYWVDLSLFVVCRYRHKLTIMDTQLRRVFQENRLRIECKCFCVNLVRNIKWIRFAVVIFGLRLPLLLDGWRFSYTFVFEKGKCGFTKGKCGFAKGKCGFVRGKCGFVRGKCGFTKGKCGFVRGKCGFVKGKCGFVKGKYVVGCCWLLLLLVVACYCGGGGGGGFGGGWRDCDWTSVRPPRRRGWLPLPHEEGVRDAIPYLRSRMCTTTQW